jgi:hypothetical protein
MEIEKLSECFNPMDIEWRIQQCGWSKDAKPWAMVLAYVTNRAIMNRLDEVCGPFSWQNKYQVETDGAISCGISIFNGLEWITKWDAADATDIEAIKGGRSNAMKRAGVQWGIGRYLYNLEASFANCITDKPPQHEKPLWNKHYDKKENKGFFWRTPDLPKWALPK